MQNNTVVPFDATGPSQAFRDHAAKQGHGSLADGIGQSYGVIRYKGGKWTVTYRGEKHLVVRPDDGTPSGYIDVIILRSSPVKSKSYYENYEQDSDKRPDCASMDGIRPDPEFNPPQAPQCVLCPKNEWYTAKDGRRKRDCTDYKRLAVLLLPSLSQKLFGAPLMEPVFLRVPPASLNDLAAFGDRMDRIGYPYYSFVTRISFDPNVSYQKFVYREMTKLSDEEAQVVLPMRESALALRITGEQNDFGGGIKAISAPKPEAPVGGLGLVAAAAQAAAQEPEMEIIPPSKPNGNGAFGGALHTAAPAAAPQTVADVGEPEDSDPEMDAEIAALLNKPLV